MINKSKTLLFIILLFSLTFFACNQESNTELQKSVNTENTELAATPTFSENTNQEKTEIVVTDSLGRKVTVNATPEKIIIAGKSSLIVSDAIYLFTSVTNKIVGLGQTNQGLGDFYTHIAPNFSTTQRLPHSVSAEEIASYQPDIVFIKEAVYNDLGKKLEQLQIPVFCMRLEYPEDYLEEIKNLGELFNETDRANYIISEYNRRIEKTEALLMDYKNQDKQRILLLYATSKDGILAFNIPPKDWIQTSITEAAGGIPVWKEQNISNNWQIVSFEQIAAWDPDRIFIISYKTPATSFLSAIKQDPIWANLKAYKSDSIQTFPSDFYSWAQPDTRWILGLQWLAYTLHAPEKIKTEFTEEMNSFFEKLYGIHDNVVIEDINTRFLSAIQAN